MQLLYIIVCFSVFLLASLSIDSKPEPVDLNFECMEIIDPEIEDFKHDDVPIIFLHGLYKNKESWNGVYEIIGWNTKKKVCIVDLRNHGESPWNDEEYDVVAMTEDVKHLMDRIKAPKAIVLGHSLGGKIAVHLTLNYPERIEKIVVEDTRPNGITPAALKNAEFKARMFKELEKVIPQGVTEKEAEEEVLTFLRDYYAKMNVPFRTDDISFTLIKCSNGTCQLSTNPVLMEAVLRNVNELLNESSGRFDGPALFIYGAESEYEVGEDETNIKKLFPNAELVPVEGAGHLVHTFKNFTTEVIKFINSE